MSDRGYQPDLSSTTIVNSYREEAPKSSVFQEREKRRNILFAILTLIAVAALVAGVLIFLR